MKPGADSPQYVDLVWTGKSWLAEAVGAFHIHPDEVAIATTPANMHATHRVTFFDANGGGPYYLSASKVPW